VIIVHGRLVHLGNRIAYSEAESTNEAGCLIARSAAPLMRVPPR